MLNTGLKTGEALGLLNSDIDLVKMELSIVRAVKEVSKRDKDGNVCGTELIVGVLKTAASKRTIPSQTGGFIRPPHSDRDGSHCSILPESFTRDCIPCAIPLPCG